MPSLVGKKRRLQGHVQEGGVFSNADLRSGQCFQSSWESVAFEDSRLSMVHFVNARFNACHFVRTTLNGTNFNAASFRGVIFDNCDMEQVSFAGAVLHNCMFIDCRLAYGTFVGATLHDTVFDTCNMHGTDMDVAVATGVQYSKCNTWGMKTAFGCAFWNSGFTVDMCNRYAAFLARVHPDPESQRILTKLAGEATFAAVDRLMRAEPDGPEF